MIKCEGFNRIILNSSPVSAISNSSRLVVKLIKYLPPVSLQQIDSTNFFLSLSVIRRESFSVDENFNPHF